MAAMIKLGDWLDYLKKKRIYDNTRVIIVSDHGRDMDDNLLPRVKYTRGEDNKESFMDSSLFNSVLLVKDFNSRGFNTDNVLISNADTPAIAMKGLIKDQVNPFTENRIRTIKDDKEPKLIYTFKWQTNKNNGNTFLPSDWFTIKDSIYDPDNWEYLGYH